MSRSSASAILRCSAISGPWSQVRVLRSSCGIWLIAVIMASRTVTAVWSVGRCNSVVKPALRSTNVPIADLPFLPRIKSPSQCPGSARSATSAGRWLMLTIVRKPSQRRLRRRVELALTSAQVTLEFGRDRVASGLRQFGGILHLLQRGHVLSNLGVLGGQLIHPAFPGSR